MLGVKEKGQHGPARPVGSCEGWKIVTAVFVRASAGSWGPRPAGARVTGCLGIAIWTFRVSAQTCSWQRGINVLPTSFLCNGDGGPGLRGHFRFMAVGHLSRPSGGEDSHVSPCHSSASCLGRALDWSPAGSKQGMCSWSPGSDPSSLGTQV